MDIDTIANLSPQTRARISKKLAKLHEIDHKALHKLFLEINKDHSYAIKKSKIDFVLFRDSIKTPSQVVEECSEYYRVKRLQIQLNEAFSEKATKINFLRSMHSFQHSAFKIIKIWNKCEKYSDKSFYIKK